MSGPLFPARPSRRPSPRCAGTSSTRTDPRISTMRNYRFAIVQYDPRDEFKLRTARSSA
jgi:hypothetical protein